MIREIIQNINESNSITIYHGDSHGTKRIETKQMATSNSNMQNGPGIYFSEDLNVARLYGKDIVYAEVNPKNFIPSRGSVGKYLKLGYYMIKSLHKVDEEAMWYLLTDWGMEIIEPEDIKISDLEEFYSKIKRDEVRNFLITLVESFGAEALSKSFMKVYPNKLGTYDKDTGFYSVINTKLFLRKLPNH